MEGDNYRGELGCYNGLGEGHCLECGHLYE